MLMVSEKIVIIKYDNAFTATHSARAVGGVEVAALAVLTAVLRCWTVAEAATMMSAVGTTGRPRRPRRPETVH